MVTRTQKTLQGLIDQREQRLVRLAKSQGVVRHKCFVSFHHDDVAEVDAFLEKFQEVFIPRVLGASDEDDFIDSPDTGYVMDKIRENYLTDSTVTIVLVGGCTWARKYVDWEVYSTLRNDKYNKRSGLVAITLPSAATHPSKQLPLRVDDNVDGNSGYARWYKYPTDADSLQGIISEAFLARTGKSDLIDNTRDRKTNNSPCSQ